MKHYDSFENIKYDQLLLGEEIWASNKIDGQNFCAKYYPKQKELIWQTLLFLINFKTTYYELREKSKRI